MILKFEQYSSHRIFGTCIFLFEIQILLYKILEHLL